MKEFFAGCAAIVGLGLIIWSFLSVELRRPHKGLLVFGFLLLASVATFGWRVANAPPTPGPTDIDDRPKPAPTVATLQQKFEMDFDAYDHPSWPVAIELATCSSNAYLAPVFAELELEKRGFTHVSTLNFGSSAGYVAMIGDTAVIMFRGTNQLEIQDWLVNLNNKRYKSEDGDIHAGFWASYEALHDQLIEALRQRNPKRIWVTGHSLGGALAVVCSYRLMKDEGKEIAGVMTFGQPRVGSPEFCKYMDSELRGRMVHFVNENDLVPRIPPSFEHFGSLVWYSGGAIRRSRPPKLMMSSGDYSENDDEFVELPAMSQQEFEKAKRALNEQPNVQYSPDGQPLTQSSFRYIDDHDIELYIDRLR
ncbi:MAG: lipase family protein [Planctomycetaceae bacterium]|nr:lipase family protein [Planctomycetaceae bacterium]